MANASIMKYTAGIPSWIEKEELSLVTCRFDRDRLEYTATFCRDYDNVLVCKVYKALAVPWNSQYVPVHDRPIRSYFPEEMTTTEPVVAVPENEGLHGSNVIEEEASHKTKKKRVEVVATNEVDVNHVEVESHEAKKKRRVVENRDQARPVPEAVPKNKKAPALKRRKVEKIVDVRYRDQREFEVKWWGYPEEENSWVLEEVLQKEEERAAIHDFLGDLVDDQVEDLQTQLARLCPTLPMIETESEFLRVEETVGRSGMIKLTIIGIETSKKSKTP